MLPSEGQNRRNTAAGESYFFMPNARAIILGPPCFVVNPKFFQLYHSSKDSSMLFFTKFPSHLPGGFFVCFKGLLPFLFFKIRSAFARKIPFSNSNEKGAEKSFPRAERSSFYLMTSMPPIYILSASGILTDPSALRLFSKKAMSILGGATTVLLSV